MRSRKGLAKVGGPLLFANLLDRSQRQPRHIPKPRGDTRGTIRSCCRRFFQVQVARPHPAFCCCPSAPVWHVVRLRAFLRIVERVVYPWVGLPRVRLGRCRGLCCFPYRTSPTCGRGSQTRELSSASPFKLHQSDTPRLLPPFRQQVYPLDPRIVREG
jgi:hypothetical protein